MAPTALVRHLIDGQLQRHPRTREAYLRDAQFHAAVEITRITLTAVVEVLDEQGMSEWRQDAIVRDTLNQLLTDRLMAEHEKAQPAAALARLTINGGRDLFGGSR